MVGHFSLPFFWPCHTACGILVPRQGIEPMPPALESESQSLDCQGSSISLSAANTIHVLATPSVTGLRRGACVSLFPIGLYSVKGKAKNYDAFENLPDNFQKCRDFSEASVLSFPPTPVGTAEGARPLL